MCWGLLTIFNEGTYLTFKSIFHKAHNLFYFDCEITIESVPGTNQYQAIRIKSLAPGNNGGLWWGSNPRRPHYESDVQPTAQRRPFINQASSLNKVMHHYSFFRSFFLSFFLSSFLSFSLSFCLSLFTYLFIYFILLSLLFVYLYFFIIIGIILIWIIFYFSFLLLFIITFVIIVRSIIISSFVIGIIIIRN